MKLTYTAAIIVLGLAALAASPAAALPHPALISGPAAGTSAPSQVLERRRGGIFGAIKNLVSKKKPSSSSSKPAPTSSNGNKGTDNKPDPNQQPRGSSKKEMAINAGVSAAPMVAMSMMPMGGGGSSSPEAPST